MSTNNSSNEEKKQNKPDKDSLLDKFEKRPSHLFLYFTILIGIGLLIYIHSVKSCSDEFSFNPCYIFLALIGVIFHMMSKYREKRDLEGFDIKMYGLDYAFRAFQACVFIIIIYNLTKNDENFNGQMALFSLLVGMYIQKVESAFDSLGERFGEMLKGILGTSIERVSPDERKILLEDIMGRFQELKNNYNDLRDSLEENETKSLEKDILSIKELIDKGKISTADFKLLSTEFWLKDKLRKSKINTPEETE